MEKRAIYTYTPLCGTCQVAGRMLDIAAKIVNDLPIEKVDLNYSRDLAEKYEIESVPCLLILDGDQMKKKIYAFQSVPYLVEQLKES